MQFSVDRKTNTLVIGASLSGLASAPSLQRQNIEYLYKTYLFISTNLGVLVDGKLSAKADNMKTEVLMALIQ